jgi:putative flippase GtrA
MRHLIEQFGRFSIVGLMAAIFHYGTLIGLVEVFSIEPVFSALAGYTLGGTVSYLLNRRWTFSSDVRHITAVMRFALVTFVGFLLTGLSMALLTGDLGLHYLLAQIVTTGIIMFWSFWTNRLWTFTAGNRPPR